MSETERKKVVRRVTPALRETPKRKRVAAYCRVSSAKDAMLHSLSAQVSYYSQHIQSHPGWEYAGCYVDEGITGTKENRPKFQEMLKKCREKQIDIILTKSISRFARNTVTVLETVRELKALGVDVYFEEQNIHSMSGDGELMLSILASFAQAESESASDNCKWRIKKQFEMGDPATWRYMYGYRIEKGVVTIHPEEAEIVRWIFDSYNAGMETAEIARILRERNVPGCMGGQWMPQRVVTILRNEKFAGNALLQKKYSVDPINKVCVRNRGEMPRYFAEGTHPSIVSVETFDAAQRRLDQHRRDNNNVGGQQQTHEFTGKIVCGQCGKKYKRVTKRGSHFWNCDTYVKLGKQYCHTKRIPEDILMQTTASVLGIGEFDNDIFNKRIREIRVPSFNHLIYVFHDETEVERVWMDRNRKDNWTDEMRQKAAENARKRNDKGGERQ